ALVQVEIAPPPGFGSIVPGIPGTRRGGHIAEGGAALAVRREELFVLGFIVAVVAAFLLIGVAEGFSARAKKNG
ncbi:hypothetical protein ACFQ07_07890, partial [Actinomadura adrarensis]